MEKKKSQNDAAPFENSGIQCLTSTPLTFFFAGGKSVRESRREDAPDKHKQICKRGRLAWQRRILVQRREVLTRRIEIEWGGGTNKEIER